jgi:prepilin-type N-terminal cleavage/methylation domain-containing protein
MPDRRGFTLIELLAAMAVFVLVLILLVQVANHTLQTTKLVNQQMDATQRARTVLDALSLDLEGLAAQNGLTLFARTVAANSELAFLTQSRGPSGIAGFRNMAVAYRLENDGLVRRSSEVTWEQSDVVSRIVGAASSNTVSVIAQGILRFEAVAVLENGSVVPLSQAGSPTIFDQPIPDGFLGLHLNTANTASRVVTIIVAVAALDSQSLRLPGVSDFASQLPSPSVGETPMEAWTRVLSSEGLSGVPLSAVSALQIAQRSYSLK